MNTMGHFFRKISILIALFSIISNTQAQTVKARSEVGSIYYAPPTMPPNLSMKVSGIVDPNGNNLIDAFEEIRIIVEVTNEGPGDAYGIILEVNEENLNEAISFEKRHAVASIKANQMVTFSVAIAEKSGTVNDAARFTFNMKEANGFDPEPIALNIEASNQYSPKLEIVEHAFASEKGGTAQLGSLLRLYLLIQNMGHSPATNVSAIISVPQNVFIAGKQQTTINIPDLAAGASQQIEIDFFSNRNFVGDHIPIQCVIKEKHGLFGMDQTFRLALAQPIPFIQEIDISPIPWNPIAHQEGTITVDPGPSSAGEQYAGCLDEYDIAHDLPGRKFQNPDGFAILIANRNYEFEPLVEFAQQDAEQMKTYLVEVAGFTPNNVLIIPDADFLTLQSWFGKPNQANSSKLYGKIKSGKTDLVVYYSGHGVPGLEENNRGRSYLLPINAHGNRPTSEGYDLDVLYQNLSQMPARNKLILLDACFSGKNLKGTETSGVPIPKVNPPIFTDPAMVALTAASGAQYANWYRPKGHGMFSYFVFKAMHDCRKTDTNGDGQINIEEIFTAINDPDEGIPFYSGCMNNELKQNPQIQGQNKHWNLFSY